MQESDAFCARPQGQSQERKESNHMAKMWPRAEMRRLCRLLLRELDKEERDEVAQCRKLVRKLLNTVGEYEHGEKWW